MPPLPRKPGSCRDFGAPAWIRPPVRRLSAMVHFSRLTFRNGAILQIWCSGRHKNTHGPLETPEKREEHRDCLKHTTKTHRTRSAGNRCQPLDRKYRCAMPKRGRERTTAVLEALWSDEEGDRPAEFLARAGGISERFSPARALLLAVHTSHRTFGRHAERLDAPLCEEPLPVLGWSSFLLRSIAVDSDSRFAAFWLDRCSSSPYFLFCRLLMCSCSRLGSG